MYKYSLDDKLYPSLKIHVLPMTVKWLQKTWPSQILYFLSNTLSVGLQFQISCCIATASADFFWVQTGPVTFSDRLGQMLKEPGQHSVVNERDTDPRGTIWTSGYLATSWFLINKWCGRRQSCINTCWETAVTRRGTALGIITWSQHSRAHIKAKHVGHPIFFTFCFSFAFHTTHCSAGVRWLPPCEPWGAELPGQLTSAASGLRSTHGSLAGLVLRWFDMVIKYKQLIFPSHKKEKHQNLAIYL